MSMHVFRAFPRSRLDLGKVHLWATWLCITCPEGLIKVWVRAGLAFAERAAHKWPGIVFTEDLPLKALLLLKDISFGILEATCALPRRSPCSPMRSCWSPLGSSTPGHCFPVGLSLCTVLYLCGEGGITDACLLCATQRGERVLASPCLLRAVGQPRPQDRCALQDWETVGSAVTLPWATREMQ